MSKDIQREESMSNPVLVRATGETLNPDASGTTAAPISGARMTMDDVIVKTGLLFVTLVAGAYAGWNLVITTPSVLWISMIVAVVLSLVNSFKKEVSPALTVAYAVAEGIFIGGLSRYYSDAYADTAPNLVSQAVIGTFVAFGVMLGLYRSRIIKVNGKFMKVFMVAMASYLVIALASFVASMFGVGNGWGFYGVSGIGLLLCVAGVGLAAFSLVVDFELITQAVNAGAPEKESWRMAFGLMVSLVWLYLELLRLLAILQGRD
jgi:uncharacterized YccA/Bax inhibitor family protein